MAGYRISELAGRTGFSPSTLRYYEQVGLLRTERSRNGYRVYGDAEVARLRFIARAKRLRLSLGDIRELVSVWDGGRCQPVKDRLGQMLAARSRGTASQIGELTAFGAELSDAQDALARATPAGPCDDGCGCTTEQPDSARRHPAPSGSLTGDILNGGGPAGGILTGGGPAGGILTGGGPAGGEPAAESARTTIACTLGLSDKAERVREWTDLLSQATERRSVDEGVRFTFPASAKLAGHLADLAVREQQCCAFLTFAVQIAGAGRIIFEVRAPHEGRRLLGQVFGAG